MKKVKVVDIEDEYLLTLEDTIKKIYKKNIEFYDVNISIGDYIYIDDKVLYEDNIYTYGALKNEAKEEDFIKIVKGDQHVYLQRYYG